MPAYIWGSEVPPLVFTFILAEGYCNIGSRFGLCHFPHADLDSVLTVRALNPCQDCSSEAQEWGRASGSQTSLTHLLLLQRRRPYIVNFINSCNFENLVYL
jgi:hypothetical protein